MGDSNDRLKEARKAAKFRSAAAAARKHGWVYTTYSSHENGQTPVPIEAAFEYGKAFKASAIWILHGVGPRKGGIDAMLHGQPDAVWDHARDAVATILKHKH